MVQTSLEKALVGDGTEVGDGKALVGDGTLRWYRQALKKLSLEMGQRLEMGKLSPTSVPSPTRAFSRLVCTILVSHLQRELSHL